MVRRSLPRLAWPLCVACSLVVIGGCENLDGLGAGANEPPDGGPKKPGDAAADSGFPGAADTGTTPTGPRCDPSKPFGTPELVSAFDGASNARGAILAPDELDGFYMQGNQLRHASRPTLDSPWTVESITTLSPAPTGLLSVTINGLKIYYDVFNQASSDFTYYAASRNSRSEPFGPPKLLQVPQLGFNPAFVVLNSDDVTFFTRTTANIGRAVSTGMFGYGFSDAALTQHPGVTAPGSDTGVVSITLNSKGTALYFNSDTEAVGKTKQWVARRASSSVPFTQPATMITELTDAATGGISWVSDDDCEVFLDRSSHIYLARRPL